MNMYNTDVVRLYYTDKYCVILMKVLHYCHTKPSNDKILHGKNILFIVWST